MHPPQNMDTSILTSLMLVVGVLMFMLPFFIFIVLGSAFTATANDPRLLFSFLIMGAIIMYLISFGAFSVMQRFNCGKVKSYGKIAENAGISTAIYSGMVALSAVIPWLRGVVTNVISPEVDENVRQSLGYGYYSFWGSLFGIAIGGTFSSIC
jgi:uncharacterized membrane protein